MKKPRAWTGLYRTEISACVLLWRGVYAHLFAALGTLDFESHDAIDLGEEGMIGSAPHIHAGMKPGAPLPHEDIARPHDLATEPLDPKAFRFRIATITAAAACFFMRHCVNPY
jgi:hypothetical protein